MKRCADCGETKPFTDFHRSKTAKDGHHAYCKQCSRERLRSAYKIRGKKSWVSESKCTDCNRLLPKNQFGVANGRTKRLCLACEAVAAVKTTEGLKQCNSCRKWLPRSEFYASHLNKRAACQECTKAWHRAHADERRTYTLKKEYGITAEQYDELLAKQGYKCPVCGVAFELGSRSYPVDHAHGGPMKGRIRAILHDDCNRFVMWMHEDSAQLRRAADLIDNPLTDWVVPNPTLNERRREKERNKK
jgi:hypothetical protein